MFKLGDRIRCRDPWIQQHWDEFWKKKVGATEEFGVFYVIGFSPFSEFHLIYSSRPDGEGPLGGALAVMFDPAPSFKDYDPNQQPWEDGDI